MHRLQEVKYRTLYRRVKITDNANCARKITYLRDYYHKMVSQRDADNDENSKKNFNDSDLSPLTLSIAFYLTLPLIIS